MSPDGHFSQVKIWRGKLSQTLESGLSSPRLVRGIDMGGWYLNRLPVTNNFSK
jgi:hypothetical protein